MKKEKHEIQLKKKISNWFKDTVLYINGNTLNVTQK